MEKEYFINEIKQTKEMLKNELREIYHQDSLYYNGKRMGIAIALARLDKIELYDNATENL